jgi:hypothetical protein
MHWSFGMDEALLAALVATLAIGSGQEVQPRVGRTSAERAKGARPGQRIGGRMIKVYIDSMVWNLLFQHQLNLSAELPREHFELLITREVELEILSIPAAKADLKAFIQTALTDCSVETDKFFGFPDPSIRPNEQRVGGFGDSRWQTKEEREFLKHKHHLKTNKKRSGLYGNEADLSQAARAHHSVIS